MKNQPTNEQKHERDWKRLKPGYNRVFLSSLDIAHIRELRAAGCIDNRFRPAIKLGTFLGIALTERAGQIPTGGSIGRAATDLDAAAASTPQQEAA